MSKRVFFLNFIVVMANKKKSQAHFHIFEN
jgi:hypothetical protein